MPRDNLYVAASELGLSYDTRRTRCGFFHATCYHITMKHKDLMCSYTHESGRGTYLLVHVEPNFEHKVRE
jgi:hypothetical protein